ncbi:hypothetical protein LX36DRAFT_437650 [Colletotrichum falcatum]|nr:hypothetical protein LX36DRAFT_437650 [Colletotrichum falcatum]
MWARKILIYICDGYPDVFNFFFLCTKHVTNILFTCHSFSLSSFCTSPGKVLNINLIQYTNPRTRHTQSFVMPSSTSSILAAAALLVASVHGYCQEFTFVDAGPCDKQPDGNFICQEQPGVATNVTLYKDGGIIDIISFQNVIPFSGVSINCGGPTNITVFVDTVTTLEKPECSGKESSIQVDMVKSVKQLNLPQNGYGQELTFTDADGCQQQADGSYLCGGTKISEANGVVSMTAGQADSAVRVRCDAGSSVYYCTAGASADFTQPVCANGFTSVVNVNSTAPITPP